MSSYPEILSAALNLPPDQRSELAGMLWASMDDSDAIGDDASAISPAWREEIARRSAEYERGEVQGIPWSQVREEVRRKHQGNA